tara:strand:- start:1153 stop:1509 length:357 start_codon:yes stop_codon:yes gene_type:complete
MKLFKDYEECVRVIIIMCQGLKEESLIKIKNAINVCESYNKDADKIFRLTYSFKECLWDIQEAVLQGFDNYLINQSNKIKEALAYHDVNWEDCWTFDLEECGVCQVIHEQMNRICGEY